MYGDHASTWKSSLWSFISTTTVITLLFILFTCTCFSVSLSVAKWTGLKSKNYTFTLFCFICTRVFYWHKFRKYWLIYIFGPLCTKLPYIPTNKKCGKAVVKMHTEINATCLYADNKLSVSRITITQLKSPVIKITITQYLTGCGTFTGILAAKQQQWTQV